jgi:hypothetical protein
MRRSVSAAVLVGLGALHAFVAASHADAEVILNINKSKQRMAVVVDGAERHVWKISTGTAGGPPSGTYRPQRMARKWYSRKYNWSPMPHSIFFREGYAIHGTVYLSRLGRRASHGCVRLHPKNAATLFDLVRSQGMASTTIIVSNSDFAAGPGPNLRSSLPAGEGPNPQASAPAPENPAENTGAIPLPSMTGAEPAEPAASSGEE